MNESRIKNPDLANRINEGQLEWDSFITPITEFFCKLISQRDYRNKRLAYWGHITSQNILSMMTALKQAGAKIVVGACNIDSTDDIAAAYAVSKGITVYGWQGMSITDYKENLRHVRSFEADYLCDMGGELCVAYLDKVPVVKGALEATMTGLHLLRKYEIPFPVFNWNDIPLKNLHNRYHVGDSVWPAFNQLTKMSLYGKHILVIGCGPVGKGIAERAHDLGAIVYVNDLNPVRALEARHIGCEVTSIEEGLNSCEIVCTATGIDNVLDKDYLTKVKPGTIVFNAGHSNKEIDIEWLYQQPHKKLLPFIDRIEFKNTYLFLLGQGSLINLSAGTGPFGVDQFDLYTAVMLLGIAWMFDGIPSGIKPGLHLYPHHLEQEIANYSINIHH